MSLFETPPTGELVWATDGNRVFQARGFHGEPPRILEDARWEDAEGRSTHAIAWLPLEESPDPPPVPS